MKNVDAKKIRALVEYIESKRGALVFFGLMKRVDLPDAWDVVASAKWISDSSEKDLIFFFEAIENILKNDSDLIARVVLMTPDELLIRKLLKLVRVRNAFIEGRDLSIDGLHISRCIIVVSDLNPRVDIKTESGGVATKFSESGNFRLVATSA